MFLLQKLVSRLFFPVPLTILALAVGLVAILVARRSSRRQVVNRIGVGLVAGGIAFLWLASTAPIADGVLWSLERRYMPQETLPDGIQYIVVLGSGHVEHEALGVWQSLADSARARVSEGLRLAQGNDATVVFTGYEGGGEIPSAEMGRNAAVEFGLDPDRTRVYSAPRNTAEEARVIAGMLAAYGNDGVTVALVTSASHMPRSVALFERAGVNVTAMPTDYQGVPGGYTPWSFFPSAGSLRNTERAWYEYMGLVWARVDRRRGRQ